MLPAPNTCRAIGACCRHKFDVRAESDSATVPSEFEPGDFHSVGQFPDAHRLISASRDQVTAIPREGDSTGVRGCCDLNDFTASANVRDVDRSVCKGGREEPFIRAESELINSFSTNYSLQ